jgi:hypothetical protein
MRSEVCQLSTASILMANDSFRRVILFNRATETTLGCVVVVALPGCFLIEITPLRRETFSIQAISTTWDTFPRSIQLRFQVGASERVTPGGIALLPRHPFGCPISEDPNRYYVY